MADLIPAPVLEIRDEEQLAAEAIGRTSGGLTIAIVNSQIEERRRILQLIESNALSAPVCSELTNANPSSPHTVILEAQAWVLSQMAYRINKLPKRDQIEFARLSLPTRPLNSRSHLQSELMWLFPSELRSRRKMGRSSLKLPRSL
jgi:hypothetical protein